ncbi:tyrosine-protein phosphatase non-receptor type 2 isoform X3 [Lissotriton helveticus]
MEREFHDIDSDNRWNPVYGVNEIRFNSPVLPNKIARYPENKNRNRYRDVNPFDHSRVKLQNVENDYINASLIVMEEAQRSYILTQGPLPNTCCHFWLMVWQQKSKAVVMLNRVIEKDTLGESREIYHFHYTTWPDFGVPESPASFLNFLAEVRESGSLNSEHGPAVIHCSAGIGRSGTFSLVDTCLVLMEKRKDPSSVDIKQVLLTMRSYRMGLIQTAGQLRFSYMAVIEGSKSILRGSTTQNLKEAVEDEDLCLDNPVAYPSKMSGERFNGNSLRSDGQDYPIERNSLEMDNNIEDSIDGSNDRLVRKRLREDRKANTALQVRQMKQKLSDEERKRKRPRLTDT